MNKIFCAFIIRRTIYGLQTHTIQGLARDSLEVINFSKEAGKHAFNINDDDIEGLEINFTWVEIDIIEKFLDELDK